MVFTSSASGGACDGNHNHQYSVLSASHYWKMELLPPVPWSDESAGETSDDASAIGDADDKGSVEDLD